MKKCSTFTKMTKIRYGMVGGGLDSFIGGVHRAALSLDVRTALTCGCFSRDEVKNNECGEALGISEDNLYSDWREMARAEGAKGVDGIDFVCICTPNHIHYDVCKEFLLNGINVVCEKPLCFEIEQAKELCAIAKEKNLLFGVTYTYSGYNMVKVMKQMIQRGDIGRIISVNVEYPQDWLINELQRDDTVNPSVWRTNPKYTGIGNAVGDIGTHIENLVHYVTGLEINRLCATVDRYGKQLDYNDNILVEYTNGVHGNYWCSQVAAGRMNGLKIRIYGENGSLEWEQHFPDYVKFTRRGEAPQTLSRGCAYLDVEAAGGSRIPAGHPEGFYCAFANIYRNVVNALVEKKETGKADFDKYDFPKAEDGLGGVRFVHAVIYSGDHDSCWVKMSDFE